MSVNKIFLLGNVGKDPEVKAVGETKVATFSLATTERGYTKKNGDKVEDRTEWHNIVAWRGLAEITDRYVKKGTKIHIEGKLRHRSYENKDGNKVYISEIVADNIQLLGNQGTQGAPTSEPNNSQDDVPPSGETDMIYLSN